MSWEDLDVFVSDFGVPVSFDGAPEGLRGNEGFMDKLQLSGDGYGGSIGRDRTVRVRTDAVAALRSGSAITVNGLTYKVQKVLATHDGAFSDVVLQ